MTFDPNPHQRRSIRLPGYDYSQAGTYFVTIDVQNHIRCLGWVRDGKVQLSPAGLLVRRAWLDLPQHFANVTLDVLCIMPDHIHGIISLSDDDPLRQRKRHGLPEIVRAFKSYSARQINTLQGTSGVPFWQRNYYEHIVRNDEELARIREYIRTNPQQWME